MNHENRAAALILILATLSCVGCGSGGPFEYVPVKGRLTFEDGTPIPAHGIVLQFVTMDVGAQGQAHPRPGAADLDDEGNFTCATSYKYGDGLVPGKHKVAIYYATDKKGNLLIPKTYALVDTTPLVIDTANSPLEIKVPKR